MDILGIGREKVIQPICTWLFGALPESRLEDWTFLRVYAGEPA